jgi:hypothetical protein
MRLPLILHPDSECGALDAIDVEILREAPRRFSVRFIATGAVKRLSVPRETRGPAKRVDGLWQHTCFEAFVRVGDDDDYHEFNLSPSRDWACYRFDAYRAGMAEAKRVQPPAIGTWLHHAQIGSERERGLQQDLAGHRRDFAHPFFELTATLGMEQMLDLPVSEPWHLGLSAVIEERNGNKSYWALAHPPGAPDFHHRDCFALELAAARPA